MRGSWTRKYRWGCSCRAAGGSSYGIEIWQGNPAVRPIVLRRLSGPDAALDAASADFLYLAPPFNSNVICNLPYSACGSAQYHAFQESWAITRLPGFAPTRTELQTRTPTLLTAPDSVLVWHVIPFQKPYIDSSRLPGCSGRPQRWRSPLTARGRNGVSQRTKGVTSGSSMGWGSSLGCVPISLLRFYSKIGRQPSLVCQTF